MQKNSKTQNTCFALDVVLVRVDKLNQHSVKYKTEGLNSHRDRMSRYFCQKLFLMLLLLYIFTQNSNVG